ncbi:MAG: aldehyde dehydrogenase [Pseudonocardia sp. SCN 72-86]|nr:MAG: aldehyde dehydrogenase [Pseudonocardia sp. SCN 72-86]
MSVAVPTEQPDVFVDGAWIASTGRDRVVQVDPTTERVLGSAPDGTPDDVDRAVRAARGALVGEEWAGLGPAERAGLLRAMAATLRDHADEIGTFLTRENGLTLGVGTALNVHAGAGVLDFFAGLADQVGVEEVRGTTLVRREPVGVAGLIVPWNAPLLLALMKIAPALLAGCTVVLKPAAETSLSAGYLAMAAEAAGLPPGVLNIVTGGRGTGAALVAHDGVDKIGFTGSTAAGRAVAALCGQALKPATFELGGKSAAILLEDADLDTYLDKITEVSLLGSGQGCLLSTRLLVARSRHDELCDRLRSHLAGQVVGDPLDPATTYGPVSLERQRDRVEGYIRIGREEGARVLVGGGRPAGLDRGFFVEPTVFVGVDNGMRIAREEIFGPVLTVTPFDDEDEAVALANDSEYGLGGSVFTADREHGVDVARRVQTGTIGVNGYQLDLAAPFGGIRSSGLGRELGVEGLAAYQRVQSIYHAR